MPGPLELLKRGFKTATTPLVSEEMAKPYIDAVDAPRLDENYLDPNSMLGKVESFGRGMQAAGRGFGAGALEGLRGMTSPLELAGMAAGGAGAMLGRGAKAAMPTIQVLEDAPAIKQVLPAMDDVGDLIGDLKRNLARVPNKRPAPMQELGEQAAEFAPVGGDAAYNAARPVQNRGISEVYDMLMPRMGGRGQ